MFARIWRRCTKRIISRSTSERNEIPEIKSEIISLANLAVLRQNGAIMKRLSLLIGCIVALACSNVFAQGKIDLQTSDTILGILQKNIGQVVELRMKSGEKIAGKLEKVGDKVVHLSQLTGAEFYDAAVDAEDISAVVVRTRK